MSHLELFGQTAIIPRWSSSSTASTQQSRCTRSEFKLISISAQFVFRQSFRNAFSAVQSLLLSIMRTHGAELGAGSPFLLAHLRSKSCQSHSCSASFCFFRAIPYASCCSICPHDPVPSSQPALLISTQTSSSSEIKNLSPAQIPSSL